MPLGSALTSLGGSLSVGYLIYSLQDASRSFWQWPGVLGISVLTVGALALAAGFLSPSANVTDADGRPHVQQKLRSGRESTNYQAGKNISVTPADKKK